jgi:hypothetical protein
LRISAAFPGAKHFQLAVFYVIFKPFCPFTAISHLTATTRKALYLQVFQAAGGSMAVFFSKKIFRAA